MPNPKWFIPAVLVMLVIVICISVSCAKADEIDLSIVAQIESSGNPNAYNKRSGAIGLCQITKICLTEFNALYDKQNFFCAERTAKTEYLNQKKINHEKYNIGDLYNPTINIEVADWYLNIRIPQLLKYYKKPVTLENILWAYNAGIGNVVKNRMPLETKNYIKKYKKLTRSL